MDIKNLKQLANLMEQASLASLEYSEGDTKISMVRAVGPPLPMPQPPVVPLPALDLPAPAASTEAPSPGNKICSPLVGMAYFAPAPGEAPFVKPGDKVQKGQTLCIIEAMKVMNEFASPEAGEIAEIYFEDGQLVEFGQPLFRMI